MELSEPFWNESTPDPPLIGEIRNYSIENSILPGPTNCSYVYLCFDRNNGDKKVIKFVKFIKKHIQLIINEIETMSITNHPHIIHLYESFRFNAYYCLILPYTPHRSLLTLIINQYREGIPEQIASKIMYQMLKAVEYLHELNICHRDIKPSNFLIFYDSTQKTDENKNDITIDSNCSNQIYTDSNNKSNSNNIEATNNSSKDQTEDQNPKNLNNNSEENDTNSIQKAESTETNQKNNANNNNQIPTVILSDFGFAQKLMPNETMSNFLGSPYFMAPEIFNGFLYDKSVDIWSLGISLFFMLTHRYPFPSPTSRNYGPRLSKGKLNLSILEKKKVSLEAIDLIKRMCKFSPEERITAKDALLHSWILSPAERKTETEKGYVQLIGKTEDFPSVQGI